MEKHFFFISLRKTLFLTATFVLLIGNTQPSYAMLGVDEELQVMQNGIVKGRIVDTNGEAVIGANVKLKGSNQGTITDVDGNFSLENVSEDILIVSYIGFEQAVFIYKFNNGQSGHPFYFTVQGGMTHPHLFRKSHYLKTGIIQVIINNLPTLQQELLFFFGIFLFRFRQ